VTVHVAGSRGDALRVRTSGGVEIPSLTAVGAIPGVVPLAAAGQNGPGTGYVRCDGNGRLAWKAPGSNTYGELVTVAADGSYLLEDGEDRDAWLRVQVRTAFLPSTPAEAQVLLGDRYNALGPDDVTSAEASAGLVETTTFQLYNAGAHRVDALKAWLDASVSGIELSTDGSSWSTPTTEGAALAFGNVNPGSFATLHVRRSVVAGAASNARITNILRFSWEGA
jgi:hypothetical protein